MEQVGTGCKNVTKTSLLSKVSKSDEKPSIYAGLQSLISRNSRNITLMIIIALEPSVYEGSGANILIKDFFLH